VRQARIALALICFLATLAILLAPFVALPARAQTPTNPGTTNLVACWDLDEDSGTRYDEAGSNHLTDNNTVGSTTGKVGKAAQFVRANSEYLSISDNSALSITGSMTIVSWVKIDTKDATNTSTILRKRNEYFLKVEAGSLGVFSYRVGTSTTLYSQVVPAVSTWYFVVAAYDEQTSTAYLTINGAGGVSNTQSAGADTTYPLLLGAYDASAADYWDGAIDSVVIYKRKLSDAEIAWLYNSGSGRSCDDINAPPDTPTPTATYTPTATATGVPTATPTPGAERELVLSSGDTATIMRVIDYGDILVTVMIGILIVMIVIAVIWLTVGKELT
jgi:hypothetical protein